MNFKNARTYQWSLGVQREVPGGVADVTYFASASNHMQGTRNINQPASGPGTPAQVNARRPYPAYGTINIYQWDRNANFQLLQTKLQKRLGNGLSFLATYMYSHNIDNLGTPPNQYDLSLLRGSSSTDVRHRFVVSPVYELPFGPRTKFCDRRHRWSDCRRLAIVRSDPVSDRKPIDPDAQWKLQQFRREQ